MQTNAAEALTGFNAATFDLQLRADSVRSYRVYPERFSSEGSKRNNLFCAYRAVEKSAALFSWVRRAAWRRKSSSNLESLTAEKVKFSPVCSLLVVYRPETNPLQIVSILHGGRDVERLLRNRL